MRSFLLIQILFFISLSGFSQDNDTCITIQPGPSNDKDALIHGLANEQNSPHPISEEISINAWTFGGTFGIVRSAIDFEINKHIPINMSIKYAELTLYAWGRMDGMGPHEALSGSNTAWAERIITPWDIYTLTWVNQPATTTLHRVSLPASTSGNQDYKINVTQLILDMQNNPNSSFGFLFKLKTEDYYRRLTFCSANYPDASKRPKLVICTSIPKPKPIEPTICDMVSSLSLYPNPVDDYLKISIPALNELIDVSIYDMLGRCIMQTTTKIELSNINVSTFAEGVYTLVVKAHGCRINRVKFIVI